MKVGWRAHRRNPANRGLKWPYLPQCFPLPSCLYLEEVDIRCQAWDTERKSHNHFRQSGYRVLEMPPLWLLPMLQRMSMAEEEAFWHGRDVEMGEELELGPPPPTIQLEEAGWQIPWGPAVELAQEGLPLLPLGPGPMEVDGTMVEDAVDEEADSSPS